MRVRIEVIPIRIFLAIVGIITLYGLVHLLDTKTYSDYYLILKNSGLVMIIALLGFPTSVLRHKTPEKYFVPSFMLSMLLAILLLGVLALSGVKIVGQYFLELIMLVFVNAGFKYVEALLIGRGKVLLSTLSNLTAINIFLVVLTLIIGPESFWFVFRLLMGLSSIAFMCYLVLTLRQERWKLKLPLDWIIASIYIFGGKGSVMIVNHCDSLVIGSIMSPSQIAAYSILARFLSFYNMLIAAIRVALIPQVKLLIKDRLIFSSQTLFRKIILSLLIVVFLGLGAVLFINGWVLTYIFHLADCLRWQESILIALPVFILGMVSLAGTLIVLLGLEKQLMIINIIPLFFFVILLVIFKPNTLSIGVYFILAFLSVFTTLIMSVYVLFKEKKIQGGVLS